VSARRKGPKGPARTRKGMSLVEIVVAMMILVGVVLALGGFSLKFSQASNQAHLVINANEIAATQLDAIRMQQQNYASIDSTLVGTSTVKNDFTTFTVRTDIKRMGGNAAKDTVDYKFITVTVTHPSMTKKVIKSTAVAAY
jgi:type II secretory pathway pseudopilin PulG